MADWDLEDLCTLGEIADAYKVTKQAASMWAQRYPNFPKPLAVVGSHRVYSRKQIVKWHGRKFGR